MLCGIEDDLLLGSASATAGKKHMWTNEYYKNLVRSIQECDDVSVAGLRAVRRAGELFRVSVSSKERIVT